MTVKICRFKLCVLRNSKHYCLSTKFCIFNNEFINWSKVLVIMLFLAASSLHWNILFQKLLIPFISLLIFSSNSHSAFTNLHNSCCWIHNLPLHQLCKWSFWWFHLHFSKLRKISEKKILTTVLLDLLSPCLCLLTASYCVPKIIVWSCFMNNIIKYSFQ